MSKRSICIASILLAIVLVFSFTASPAQAADGGGTYEDYTTGSTFRTETISAGTAHVCAVESDGTLNCWGLDDDGQANPISYTAVYTQIASGGQHTCAIRENGTVECWGDQTDGKLYPPDENAIYLQISAGQNFTCGLLEDGAISCWGNNDDNQIDGAPTSGVWTQVNAGYRHACAIDTYGFATCWGDNSFNQASPPGDAFYQVSGGDNHTCGLTSDSTIVCWGSNANGQAPAEADGDAYTQVSAGSTHTCAITAAGYSMLNNLVCWGNDTYGQVSDVPDEYFTQVTSGTDFTCAIEADGEVDCWGYGDDGQTALPSDLDSLGTTQFNVGGTASCLINADGSLKCWGNREFSAALLDEMPTTGVFTQVAGTYVSACAIKDNGSLICWGGFNITSNGPFVQVSANNYHACAVSPFGGVSCWGANGNGESTPPSGVLFRQVSAGLDFTCGIKINNTLRCWGASYDNRTNPPTGTYKQLSTGLWHSCAIDTAGHVQCWGQNNYNSLVEPSGTFKQISTSNYHNCAMRTDNTVYCWGMEDYYPGKPDLIANDPPAGVRFRQVTDDGFSACGITAAGSLSCWGQNNHGQTPQADIAPATLIRPTAGYAYSQQLTFTGGTAPYTASLYSGTLPPGLSINAAGLISGTPSAAAGGNTYTFIVRVRHTNSNIPNLPVDNFKTYTFKVNRPPVGAGRTVHVAEDSVTDISFSATDADGDALNYSVRSSAFWHCAYFMLLDKAVRYEPDDNWNGSGDYFEYRATDGLVTTDWYRIDIIVDPVNDAPVPPAQGNVTWQIEEPASLVIAAFTDVDNTSLTYSARRQGGGALPTWLPFNASTRTFSGTPPANAVGSYVLEVIASDGQTTEKLTFTLNIVEEFTVYLPLLRR